MTNTPSMFDILAFRLGQEEYGVDILKVQEIRGRDPVTRIAGAQSFIEGVVNLRGTIVPIVDLRQRFQTGARDANPSTVVVVLHLAGRMIGLVVDGVSDVVRLGPDEIRPAPAPGTAFDTELLLGLGTVDGRMLILLDIERLMSSAELGLIDRIAA